MSWVGSNVDTFNEATMQSVLFIVNRLKINQNEIIDIINNLKSCVGERILCAAIHYDTGREHSFCPTNIETGIVFSGWRHPQCFALLTDYQSNVNYTSPDKKALITQGFLTSENRFVKREEAYEIAKRSNQIKFKKDKNEVLFSEDIY